MGRGTHAQAVGNGEGPLFTSTQTGGSRQDAHEHYNAVRGGSFLLRQARPPHSNSVK
jgi:hypothetical protein